LNSSADEAHKIAELKELYIQADSALYEAKKVRNAICVS
jgi:GGDEF domain-containing protein